MLTVFLSLEQPALGRRRVAAGTGEKNDFARALPRYRIETRLSPRVWRKLRIILPIYTFIFDARRGARDIPSQANYRAERDCTGGPCKTARPVLRVIINQPFLQSDVFGVGAEGRGGGGEGPHESR